MFYSTRQSGVLVESTVQTAWSLRIYLVSENTAPGQDHKKCCKCKYPETFFLGVEMEKPPDGLWVPQSTVSVIMEGYVQMVQLSTGTSKCPKS